MEIIFEKEIEIESDGALVKDYIRCSRGECTHVHYCSDGEKDRCCKRIKIEDYIDG